MSKKTELNATSVQKVTANAMQCVFSRMVPVVNVQRSLFTTISEIAGTAGMLQCNVHTDKVETVYSFLSADGICATLHIQALTEKGGGL